MTDARTNSLDRPLRVLLPAALVAVGLHVSLLPVAASYLSPRVDEAEPVKPAEAVPAKEADLPEEPLRDVAYPDLVVSAADWPTSISPGRAVPLRFDVTNRGAVDTGPTLWGDRVYLSTDDAWDDADVMLLSVPRMAELPANTRYVSGPHPITLDPTLLVSPRMFLIIRTDDTGDLDEGGNEGNNQRVLPFEVVDTSEALEPEELKLGRDDAPPRVTVAWVSHDAFQDLLARKSRTHQPIVQSDAPPTPGAPLIPDPLDAGQAATSAAASPAAAPSNPTDSTASATSPAAAPPPGTTTPLAPGPDGTLPTAPPAAQDSPSTAANPPPPAPAAPTPATPTDEAREAPQAPLAPEQRRAERPTSAPESDREADPTALLDSDRVRPGQVLVGPGLEVRTFRPDFSAAARGFAVPRNPEAVITFATDGTVVAAELTTSTGFANVDSPLLNSLYRWRATGERLKRFDKPFEVKITILLGGE